MASATQPNTTLYVNNLNDKVNKEELRIQLYALFTTYGKVIDVIAAKGQKMKGQAFLVFSELAAATTAMRACEGMVFYDKPLRIQYAKTKSYATSKRDDPNFVPPSAVAARAVASLAGPSSDKRAREEDGAADGRPVKKEKSRGDDEDDEEMEIEEDEDAAPPVPSAVDKPSARLLCTNLPVEVTDDVLSLLFKQYQGFQNTQVVPAPNPNAAGQKVKMAQALFDSAELATAAKDALDGFNLKKGWPMTVVYI